MIIYQKPLKPLKMLKVGEIITISGFVIDSITKNPAPFINVSNGVDASTTTNDEGYFLLTYNYADNKNILLFQFVGYESQTIDISSLNGPTIDFLKNIELVPSGNLTTLVISAVKNNKFWINGFVVDENSKGIPGVEIELKYFLPLPADLPPNPIPIDLREFVPPIPLKKNVITNNNGAFEIGSTLELDLKDATLTFNTPNYNEKIIDLSNAYSEPIYLFNKISPPDAINVFSPDSTDTGRVYPIGRVNLTPINIAPPTIEQVKAEVKQAAVEALPSDEPEFMQRLIIATTNAFNTALDKLVPYLQTMLLAFGPAMLLNFISKNCPSTDKLKGIISARNSVVNQVNALYNGLRILTSLTRTTTTLTTTLTTALNLYYISPILANTLTAGAIAFLDDNRQTIKEDIDKTTGTLKGITAVTAYCLSILAYVLNILNILDQAILACAEENSADFNSLNAEITKAINASVSSITPTATEYRGFKLELKLDTLNNTTYPKRYAQALNKQNIPVLRTDSSFASNPQVLLDQLKFLIDSNPNITAE